MSFTLIQKQCISSMVSLIYRQRVKIVKLWSCFEVSDHIAGQ